MHALKKLPLQRLGRPPEHRWALIVLTLLGLIWPFVPAGAQPEFCPWPFADREHEIICSNPESRNSERRLLTEHRALTALLHSDDIAELEREQAEWRQKRRANCEAKPSNEAPDCFAEWTTDRASLLRRQVDYVIKDGLAVLSLRDRRLDVRWIVDRANDGAIITQLRLGKRVLAEAHGPNRFNLLARAGNDDTEAVVVRADKEGGTYAIVGRKDAPPEIWQVRLSRAWMREPPAVVAEGERLEIREQAQASTFGGEIVDSVAHIQWTPATGWRIAEPYRARPTIPQPRMFFGGAGSGSDCTSTLENQETMKLGSRSLTIGQSASGWLLMFGCETLIESGPNRFDFTSERQIGPASVVLSTEYNSGNVGFVDRHLLADIRGQGVQVWPLPGAEVGPDNGSYLFLAAASPGMDGGSYRWTPSGGVTFEGYRTFTPKPDPVMPKVEAPKDGEDHVIVTENLLYGEETYRAFASASGPSFIRLAFELSNSFWPRSRLDRRLAPELVVFTDCDGSRFCDHQGGKMIGVLTEKTRQFYFAFSHDKPQSEASLGLSRRPSVWEYHPPLELWPQEVAAAFKTQLGDLVAWGGSDD